MNIKGFTGFTKRNMMIYFKDVQSVIFSVLTSIIVFVLYLLFLKGTFVDSINQAMEGLEDIVNAADIEMLANCILLTGIIGSAMITVPYNCLQTIVRDREARVDYDILATPLKRWQIILSYFVSAVLSACLVAGFILTVGLLILSSMGCMYMSAENILLAYAIVALGTISSTAFFMVVVMFFKTSAASGAFFGILSAAAGFVIGAYIPISQFSGAVQTFCNLFPASHLTIMMRNALLNGVLENIDKTIDGLDEGIFVSTIKNIFGFKAQMFGHELNMSGMGLYASIIAILTIVIMTIMYNRTYKRK